jgi:hypothetical protein
MSRKRNPEASSRRRPERKERKSRFVPRSGIASDRQLELPLGNHGDESTSGKRREDAPVRQGNLLERVLEADNLRRALRRFGATEALRESTE